MAPFYQLPKTFLQGNNFGDSWVMNNINQYFVLKLDHLYFQYEKLISIHTSQRARLIANRVWYVFALYSPPIVTHMYIFFLTGKYLVDDKNLQIVFHIDAFWTSCGLCSNNVTCTHWLWIRPVWVRNQMLSKAYDEITYPILNFNGCTIEV